MAKYYTIVCNNFKAKNVTKFMANVRFFNGCMHDFQI